MSLLLSTLLSAGCATVPPVAQTCPKLPEPPARVPLGPSFQERMDAFLQGKLPEPISYELRSPSAKGGLKP